MLILDQGSNNLLKEQALREYLNWALYNLKKSNDDNELHDFIEIFCGFNIPRKKVCPHHNAPFEFVADTFFERELQVIVLANRNGGKTQNFGIKNFLDSLFKGCEIASVGAIQQQAEKCYNYTRNIFLNSIYLEKYCIESLMKRTRIRTNDGYISEISILAGTKQGVNSPHPEKVNLDEVELMDWEILQEAMSMPKSSKRTKASLCITSTRKYSYGPMQRLLNESKERGFKVYQWCIWETIERCSDERSGTIWVPYTFVPYGQKEPRTIRVLNGCLECELVEVCQTKAKHSDGYYSIDDTINKFKNLDREVWDAQWECKKPGRTGLIYNEFGEQHIIDNWLWRPELPTYAGQDFGYTHPAATIFVQVTPSEDIYIFDEEYVTKTNTNILIYRHWLPKRRLYRVLEWWCDSRGNDEMDQMKAAGIPVKAAPGGERVEDGIRSIRTLLRTHRGKAKLYVSKNCKNFIEDMEIYHYVNESEKPSEEGSHGPDAARYLIHSKWPANKKKKKFGAKSA